MNVRLGIGGEELVVRASRRVLEAMEARYGPFRAEPGAGGPLPRKGPIRLDVRERAEGFRPEYEEVSGGQFLRREGDRLVLGGTVAGRYDLVARRGLVEDVTGLGAVDALLRVALSASLPLGGGLLLHAAALRPEGSAGVVLCGASGAGKSTAARRLGGVCDELAVLRPAGSGVELLSTPYWNGRPFRASCRRVVCLRRGGTPGVVAARGAEAPRLLAGHVIRYAALDRVDRAILALASSIGSRVEVIVATCPEGAGFVPYLADALSLPEAA